jgi:pilus assembly protein CpaE
MSNQALDATPPGSTAPVGQIPQIDPVPRVSIQVFCETQEVAGVVQSAMADRRMRKAHVKQNMGGAAAAVESYRNSPTPNVIVLEATSQKEPLLSQLDDLAQYCDAGTKVIVIGRVNDIVLYRQLIARGVSEYLVWPFGVVEFVGAISHLFRGPNAKPVGRVVSIVGAKGGVGASTIAHNLAWQFSSALDMATVVADFDLGFGTAALDFNQDPPQGVAEAVFAPERVDANLVDRLLSKCGEKLSLLAAPAMLDRLYDFNETAFDPLVDTIRASSPWVVLDIPHAWNAWTRRMLVGSDEVIIVAAPDLANLRNAKNIMDNIRGARPHDHPPRLVLNGVGMQKRPEISVPDFAKTIEVEPIAVIPHDAKLFGAAANNGQMISEIDPKGRCAEIIADIAALIAGRTETRKAKRNLSLLDPLLARFSGR